MFKIISDNEYAIIFFTEDEGKKFRGVKKVSKDEIEDEERLKQIVKERNFSIL